MTKEIAKVFYDKTVHILTREVTIDAEGGINARGYNVIDTFKGNVNFSNCKQIQEEYGLDYNIDISITTNYDSIKLSDLIKYNDVVYNVTDVITNDSHLLVVATKWRN